MLLETTQTFHGFESMCCKAPNIIVVLQAKMTIMYCVKSSLFYDSHLVLNSLVIFFVIFTLRMKNLLGSQEFLREFLIFSKH
jgi:hypothetical protein